MRYFKTLLGILLPVMLTGQNLCGTDFMVEQDIHQHPEKQELYEKIWNQEGFTQNRSVQASYVIPVVVHVIHDNEKGNISYEQVEDAIRVLNEDMARENADTADTRAIFKPYATGVDVEFRLAQYDPSGNCTNGIVRINNPSQSNNASNSVKSLSYWPSDSYFNIWVVNTIENNSGTTGTILGYAQFPGSGNWSRYGVVIRNDRMGGIGTGASNGDRTLTHEVGHCLNLLHVFQSGCGNSCSSSGDRVCDTPPMLEATYGCSTGQNTCSNDASGSQSVYNGNVVDQIENYMSYDDCQNMFTQGQATRMITALNQYSQLQNLWSAGNLASTGVDNMYANLCMADFNASATVICAGQTVTYTNTSFHFPDSISWNLPGSDSPTASGDVVTVSYLQPGVYNASITAQKGTQIENNTKSNFIVVLPQTGAAAPLTESFEGSSNIQNLGWFTDDTDGVTRWGVSSGSSTDGSFSAKCYADGTEFKTSLYSKNYDTRIIDNATLTLSFDYAHARRASGNIDALRVYASSNCGATWNLIWSRVGQSLQTVGYRSTNWSPSSQNDWEEVNIPLSSIFIGDQVRLRFELESDGGNNLYLDRINIAGDINLTPALVNPYNNAIVGMADPEFKWLAIPQVDLYQVEIDTNNMFNSGLNQIQTVQSNGQGVVPNTTDFGVLNEDYTYFWRVRSVSNGAASAWSNTWNFSFSDSVSAPGPSSMFEAESAGEIKVYPNPNAGQFTVSSTAGLQSISIYSLSGVLIDTYRPNGANTMQLQLDINAGIYILKSEDLNGQSAIKRIILQR